MRNYLRGACIFAILTVVLSEDTNTARGIRCSVNEVYQQCGTACPRTCANYGAQIKCTAVCKSGCFCKEGFIRNDDGKCVKPEQCLPGGCSPGKVYTSCVNPCNDCYRKGVCDGGYDCVGGCTCPPGQYELGLSGDCVPEKKCPIRPCPVNEVYSECVTCPRSCKDYNRTDIACAQVCREGCFCRGGFVRNDVGVCVKPEQCYQYQCPVNEVYQSCGTACPKTCKNLGVQIYCEEICVKGCFCTSGFVRNDDGKCVKPTQCPDTRCPVNEVYKECGPSCQRTCANNATKMFCPAVCKTGCFCKDGLIRNDYGVCVKPEQCVPVIKCPTNEVYQECGTACPRTCSNYGYQIKCTAECKKGCFCKEGFIRNDYGKCVKPEQCVGGCPSDKVYTSCVNPCNDCYRKGVCDDFYDCVPGCDCPPGQYMFGYGGKCVPEDQCPIVDCPVDEVYNECGSACPPTCKDYYRKDIACIQVCKSGCFCRDGLVRNDDGICVEPDQCDSYECPANEEYQSCGTACPQTCKNYGIRINCIDLCVKGCFCKKGFIRNDDGKCVQPNDCVPGGCPLNEQYSSCVDICNDCSIKGACSFLVCNRGCDCIPGYTRSAQNKICIPKNKCPENNCPVNEVYSTCVVPCNDCYTKGKCEFLVCNKGCDCRKGYYRQEYTGICIPEALCPVPYK